MSTAVATRPGQLYFPWMQAESQLSRNQVGSGKSVKDPKKPSIAQQTRQSKPTKVSNAKQPESKSLVNASAPVSIFGGADLPGGQIAQRKPVIASSSVLPNDGRRVGPVRIGDVMLSLLKKYGITDQEISDVLATIAQEECQGLAS